MSKVIQNLFSKKETAKILGTSVDSVQRLIKSSKIKAVKVIRSTKITLKSLENYYANLTGEQLCLSKI